MPIARPLLGQISQGYIFTCGRADYYKNCQVHGFVLTARCDIEQEKFPILNYLPVVKLDDWLMRDGFDLLSKRLEAEADGLLSSALAAAGISESLLLSQSMRDIEAAFFTPPPTDKKAKSAADLLSKAIARRELIEKIQSEREEFCSDLYALNEKMATGLLKDLVQQKITGYYFLPSVYDSNDDEGYVILMREVNRVTRDCARAIAGGLDQEQAAASGFNDSLDFDRDKFAMPVGELSSPAVEHVLQSFGNLFGRIGLEDLPKKYIDTISTRRPKKAGP